MEELTKQELSLAKMMITYQLMYQTKNPTAAVQLGIRKLQATFRPIMKKKWKMWERVRKYQIDVYNKAWENTEISSDGRTLSMGLMITKLFHSIPKQHADKYIGAKAMERVTDSYFFAKINDKDAYEIEKHADILITELLRLMEGQEESAFAKKIRLAKKIKEQNDILEKG